MAEFARLTVTLEELCERLGGMIAVDFGSHGRRITSHFAASEPGIRITKGHIAKAIARRAADEISARELSNWAAMLLMNDAYDWSESDEEEIAETLNDLAWLRTG